MKRMLRHILWAVSAACLVPMLMACDGGPGPADEPSAGDGTVMLVLNTDVLGASRAAGTDGLPDAEKMKTLRIVILHPDGTVEQNLFRDFDQALTEYDTQLVKVRQNETKTICLIANEGGVEGLSRGELNAFEAGSAGFMELVDGLSFVPDYAAHPLPMSSVYEVQVGEKTAEFRFHVVRVATKFTFRFTNMRDDAVAVNSVAVSDIAGNTYLMPRKKALTMLFAEEDGSETECYWIDWLKRVADESQADPDNKDLADRRGWITDYDIPADAVSGEVVVAAPEGFAVAGAAHDMGVPKPGEAVYPAFYLPESKHLKNPSGDADGEQAYTMTFDLTDGENGNLRFEAVPFDNLKALFRNTHVVVDVTLYDKEIRVDVIPYSEVILEPVFGL